MRRGFARVIFRAVASVFLLTSGCTYTVAGNKLPNVTPTSPSFRPRVEHTVGDFAFTLEGGKMVTSNFVGRTLSGEIMAAWKKRGFILEETYVDAGKFSGKVDYELTLRGTQYGASNIGMQIFAGLTLFLLPYTVTQNYDIEYVLTDRRTGKKYSATVQEWDKTYVELFLLFTLPVAHHGHRDTVRRMGDHLYQEFHRQGAFRAVDGSGAGSP